LVESWRIDSLLPVAVAMYQELGDALGQPFLFRYRLRRLFADERERTVAREKWARGDFAGFGQSLDEGGLWIAPAYRVDLAALAGALRKHWRASGRWRKSDSQPTASGVGAGVTVRCVGLGELAEEEFGLARLVPVKGELLEIETAKGAFDPEVILNRREWFVPLTDSRGLVGATVEPGVATSTPTDRARANLEKATTQLLGEISFRTVLQRAGVRVVAPDKHPIIGRHPEKRSLGIFNGLGSKGALLGPWLAQEWTAHLQCGRPIDPAIEVTRFWR
jgi:glycine oxidase